MKKQLIAEDSEWFEEILGDVSLFEPVVRKVIDTYEELELGPFTSDILDEIRLHGDEGIAERYNSDLQSQLNKSGITNKNLRQVAMNGTEIPLRNFEEACINMMEFIPKTSRDRRPVVQPKHLSYSDGKVVMSELSRNMFQEEYCRTYLYDQEDLKIYSVLKNLKTSIDQYMRMVTEYNLPSPMYGTSTGNILDQAGLSSSLTFNKDLKSVEINAKTISLIKNYDVNR